MPAENSPSDTAPCPDYSHLDKEQSTTKSRVTYIQQSQSRSTATRATARPDYTQYEKEQSTTRAIYRGPRRKLVLAFDVGTTYSGISYR